MNVAKGTPAAAAWQQGWKPLLLLACIGLSLAVAFASGGAAAASPGARYSLELNYQETDEALGFDSLDHELRRNPFLKEPALGSKAVFRGVLFCGERPDQGTGFIWDKSKGRLYLDLNHNLDVTDDPQGVFVSPPNEYSQTFTNIHWTLPPEAGDRTVRLKLGFYSPRPGSLNVYAGRCYLWAARVSLRGADWELGVADGKLKHKAGAPPETLLVRPWSEHRRPYRAALGTPYFCGFTTNLYFGRQTYALSWRYEPGAPAGKYRLSLQEQNPPLGELKVSGTGLHRLILTGSRHLVLLLDQPQGTHRVPVGTYSLSEIWLRQGDAEFFRSRAGRINVDARQPASLVAGGPLTNSAVLASEWEHLRINYKLLGADGGAYRPVSPDYKHPPEFAIFQGTNRLGSGKFTFG
jgi:hypothetical protein